MAVEWKKNYGYEKERLDKLIEEGISLYQDETYTSMKGKNIHHFEEIEFLLLDDLERMTTLKNEFQAAKMSYARGSSFFGGTFLFNLLGSLGRKNIDNNADNLVEEINNLINQRKKSKMKDFIAYIPLRMRFDLNKKDLSKIRSLSKKAFGFKIIEDLPKKRNEEINNTNLSQLFQERETILEIKGKARDAQFFMDNFVNKNVNPYLGLISFSICYGRYKSGFSTIPSSSKPQIEKPKENQLFFILFGDDNVIHPIDDTMKKHIETSIREERGVSMVGKTEWNIHNKANKGNFLFACSMLKSLKKKNPKIMEKVKDFFRLYYEAITEEQEEMSFLKFWILVEKIYKGDEGASEDKIIRTLRKLGGKKCTKERISQLVKKRNALVHEMNCFDIFESDRKLSKAISENLLKLFIFPPYKFENYSEFGFMLDNILVPDEEKQRRIKILRKLK